ncbi:MAG TPA: CvpA family protein [Terriglobales bacterium]|nr:CvpA family protein [Terriglobales bacterium]
MNAADWLIVAVVLLSSLLAAAQGFFVEIFSLAGVAGGYLLAAWGYRLVAAWYAPYVSSPWIANVAGFLTIFAGVVLLAGVAGRLARWGVREAGLRWFDRLLGGVFGFARGLAVAMVVLVALASFVPASPPLSRSRFAPYLLVVARAAVWLAPSDLRAQFHAGIEPKMLPVLPAPGAAGK